MTTVTAERLASEVSAGMYSARHGLNDSHLRLLWENLGHFVASSLCSRKVRSTVAAQSDARASVYERAEAFRTFRAHGGALRLPFACWNRCSM